MKEAESGSMLWDGWPKNGVHCVGLFVYFVKKTLDRKKGKAFCENVATLVLLVCLPLGNTGKLN